VYIKIVWHNYMRYDQRSDSETCAVAEVLPPVRSWPR
jgi:hypothetical protein